MFWAELKGSHPEGSYALVCPLEFIDPGGGECFAYTLLTNGAGYPVRVAMNSTWAMFDNVIELGKCFDPPSQIPSGRLNVLSHFKL